MTVTLSFTEAAVFQALRGLLLQIIPPGTEVIRAQVNRTPEPSGTDFIVLTQIRRTRLELNIDSTTDVIFQGSIAGAELTVFGVLTGAVYVGAIIDGVGVSPNTTITRAISSGLYAVTPAQTVERTSMYAGVYQAVQPTQLDIQLDIHGPASGDNVQIISTLIRDEFATSYFDKSGLDIQALYASEPRQAPFINGESQVETRWSLDVSLQISPIVQVPQQFADRLSAGLINVDSVFPP